MKTEVDKKIVIKKQHFNSNFEPMTYWHDIWTSWKLW